MTQGGHTTLYYYDDAGRMQTLDNGLGNVFDFTYDTANRLKVRNNRQGVATGYTYNSAGLVTNILSNQNGGSGTTLNTDTYTYDPAGNRATSASYDGYTAYTYDAADQVTGENHNSGYPSFIATYDYDHNGNRLHKTQNGQTDTYHYQANASNSQTHTDELLSVQGGIIGSKTFGYDTNGVARTLTTNGTTLYLTADAEDRYTRFDFNTGPGQGSAYAYEYYNGMGLRTFRHDVWGHDFPEAYDGASPGSALLSSGFVSSGQTLFTPGLAQQDSNGQHFYQTDALGSVRGVSGNNQAPQGEVYYDAFGLPSVRQGSQPSPLGFAGAAGYQTDADTGLMLLGNRYYDPSIGRFLSPDPSGSGDNWYAYCDNDPTGEVDPEGLDATPDPTKKPPFSPDPGAFGPGTGLTYLGETDDNGVPDYHVLVGLAVQEQNVSIGNGTPGGGGNSFAGRDGGGPPGYGDAVTSGLSVGINAVASAFSAGLYNGGNARHDPTFNTSRNLATIAAIAIPGEGEENLEVRGLEEAKSLYPNKAGREELHHIIPKYLGGPKNGPLKKINATYHQVITNEFRSLRPYGLPKPSPDELQKILDAVYSKYPLP